MHKKLYALIALTVLSFSGKSAVVYTDIKPDSSQKLSGSRPSWFTIDFNKDGTEDYNFRWDIDPANYFVHVTFAPGNELAVTGTVNPFGAEVLSVIDAGKTVGASLNWKAGFPEPIIADDSNPNFAGKGDKYIGVRFKVGTNVHYGWILINFTAPDQLVVKAYAYENVPNTAIVTGEKPTSISTISAGEDLFRIFPNPTGKMLNVHTPAGRGTLSILDLNGKTAWSGTVTGSSMQLDISHLVTGHYILRLVSNDRAITQKLIIQ